jgi:predicted RND superfamily exporter protein
MSTPYKGEYGDWFGELKLGPGPVHNIPAFEENLKSHHQKDYEEIYKYTGIKRDDAFKRIAIKNIKSHPVKYIKNCISNIGRLIFSYPYTYSSQSIYLKLPYNGIIIVLMVFCIIPTFKNWRKIIFPIRIMLFFVFLYLGLTTLVSAYTRMFTVIVPILLVWIAFVIQKSVKINLKFEV